MKVIQLLPLILASSLYAVAENVAGLSDRFPPIVWIAIAMMIALIALGIHAKRTDGNVNDTEDGFDQIAAEESRLKDTGNERIQHYKFTHEVLKDMFFEDRDTLISQVLKSEGGLRGLWHDVDKFYTENYEVAGLDGSEIKVEAKEFEDTLFIVLQLPKPQLMAEAYFIGLIISRNNSVNGRFITLEYGLDEDDLDCTYLCEWEKEIHSNYGEGSRPEINLFKDTLVSKSDVSAKSWDDGKPLYTGEEWMIDLWKWADTYSISPLVLPRRQTELLALKELSLSFIGLQVDSLPDGICNLTNLKMFALQGAGLKNLPNNIGNLISLEALYIDQNSLTELPESFCNMVNLQRLFIGDNQIQELAPCIGEMENLVVVSVYGNKITKFPDNISNIKEFIN